MRVGVCRAPFFRARSSSRLIEIAVSDRARLEGLTQFLTQSFDACPQIAEDKSTCGTAGFEGGFCATLFRTGRNSLILKRRDVGVVDRARLESVCRGNSTVGSNPTLSANSLNRTKLTLIQPLSRF